MLKLILDFVVVLGNRELGLELDIVDVAAAQRRRLFSPKSAV